MLEIDPYGMVSGLVAAILRSWRRIVHFQANERPR